MHRYIILSMAILMLMGCQKPVKELSVAKYNPTSQDFSYLDEALKDVRVLAIGESSHGFGTMQSMKINMVKYLHEKLGYNVLVMGAGYGDVSIAWSKKEVSTKFQMINSMMPVALRTEEMLPLFEYLKSNIESEKPLEFRGMDTRMSAGAFKFGLMYIIQRLEPKVIQDSISNGLLDYNKTLEVMDNEEEWQKYMDSYLNTIEFTKSILTESREDISEMELATDDYVGNLLDYLDMLTKEVNYNFGEAYTRGLAIRDSLMAENVFKFATEEFPNEKLIVWGHNGHIEKGPGEGDNIKWMGHYLKEKLGDTYYAMGIYAKKGYIYQYQEGKASNFDIADPSFIEGKIATEYGSNMFLDLPIYDATNTSWVNQLVNGYELEAGGQVRFVPTKRFDGVMLLGETAAPKHLSNSGERRR